MKPIPLLKIELPLKFGDKDQIEKIRHNDTANIINKFIAGKKYYCPVCKNEFDNSVDGWWWYEDYLWIIPAAGNKCNWEKCEASHSQDDYETICIKTNIKKGDIR